MNNHFAGKKKDRNLRRHLLKLNPEVDRAQSELSQFTYRTVNVSTFSAYLRKRNEISGILYGYYADKLTIGSQPKPLFRKLRFSLYIRSQQTNEFIAKSFREVNGGTNPTVVYGNWSCGNVKYQEPQKDIGMLDMLTKKGLDIFLIDEHNTSKKCPECESDLETFKNVPNPRIYQREKQKQKSIKCHGLLR